MNNNYFVDNWINAGNQRTPFDNSKVWGSLSSSNNRLSPFDKTPLNNYISDIRQQAQNQYDVYAKQASYEKQQTEVSLSTRGININSSFVDSQKALIDRSLSDIKRAVELNSLRAANDAEHKMLDITSHKPADAISNISNFLSTMFGGAGVGVNILGSIQSIINENKNR